MPYVFEPKRRHRCDRPDEIVANNEAGIGAIWECPDCGQWFRLAYNQKDGMYWENIQKFVINVEYNRCMT